MKTTPDPQIEVLNKIESQLENVVKLLTIIATTNDFSALTQQQQIAQLNRVGFKVSEIAKLFGVLPQTVRTALKRNTSKKNARRK